MHHLIQDIGVVIIIATIIGYFTHKLNQPIILGYLIAGVIAGPKIGLNFISNPSNIEVISEVGLVLLLYITGLEMNIKSLLGSGKKIFTAGIGQFVICVLSGLLFFKLINFNNSFNSLTILYLSLLCALSSTAIVIKSLNDKYELDTLSGKISLGVLIIQDLWAIIILALQPNFNDFDLTLVSFAVIKSFLLVLFGFLVCKYILGRVFYSISKSPEMVMSVALGWCTFVSFIAGMLGLSIEMGALIAGMSISSSPYSIHITSKTLPLRDFFLTLFFVSVGMTITPPEITVISFALYFTLFIIITRLISMMPLLLATGSGWRSSFISAINISQLSEFSLVIAALGVKLGHIEDEIFNMLVYTMAISAVISSYFIKYNHQIFSLFSKFLRFEKNIQNQTCEVKKIYSIIILGLHRGARSLIDNIKNKYPELIQEIQVIDFNLEIITELKSIGVHAIFGDISNTDTLEHASLKDAKIIISSIPDILLKGTNNYTLVKSCRAVAKNSVIIATAESKKDIEKLSKAGADEIVLPYYITGEYIADLVLKKFR